MSAKLSVLKKSNATGSSNSEFDGMGRSGVSFAQIAPYGIISRAPSGSMVVSFPIDGNESDVIGFADALDKGSMPEPEEGEIVIGNYQSGCYMHFKNNGEIDVKGKINHLDGDFETKGNIKSDGEVDAKDLKSGGTNYNDHVHNETGSVTSKPTGG